MTVKKCDTCGEVKPITAFQPCGIGVYLERYRRGSCRHCRQIYRRKWARGKINDLKHKPCTDCGVRYPFFVMEFDHTEDNKTGEVAVLKRNNKIKRAVDESKKCDLLCANCHKVRTYYRLMVQYHGVEVANAAMIQAMEAIRG